MLRILLLALSLTGAASAPEPPRALPDQALVRVIGRVQAVREAGRVVEVEADGMTFVAEMKGRFPVLPLRAGERVTLTGALRPDNHVLLLTLDRLPGPAPRPPLTGTVLAVNRTRRRLILRGDAGERLVVRYAPQTTFVRLGHRSSPDDLNFGDRVWVDREGTGNSVATAMRVEVMAANGRPMVAVGEIVSVDAEEQQLRVRFGRAARTVIATRAVVRAAGRETPFTYLRAGERVRVSGVDRNGVVVAHVIDRLARPSPDTRLDGRIRSLDAPGRRLRIASRSLIPITTKVRVPDAARIVAHGQPLALTALRVGDRVRVIGPTDADGTLAARRIERLPWSGGRP